ncbi:MAG: T9SS type A sorting domain-containing protein [Bacteroidetes bacterium]|nr:T9SS type A sorting domain-containing protein [Bacteroidota bacterium]
MPTATTRVILLWSIQVLTCVSAHASFFDVNPPVLSNPSGCGLGLPINDSSCDATHEFQINVTSAPGNVLGGDAFLKELRLIIDHKWAADLDIFLKSPAGVLVEVTTDNGDDNDNYGNPDEATCSQYTTFLSHSAIGACNSLPVTEADAPFIGTFLPEGNFSFFNDGTSPVGIWTLIVCDDGANDYGTLEFVELVFEGSTCIAPAGVAVEQVDSTTVVLSWVKGTVCDEVIMEFGPPGFTPGSGDLAGVGGAVFLGNCPSDTLFGLLPNTAYEVYLREKCGPGNFSHNACPVGFITRCAPPPPTIIEDFNSQNLCEPICGVPCNITGTWRNAPNDNFDWIVNTDTTLTPGTGPSGDNPGGGNYLYLEASGSGCQNNKTAVLMSNCIEVQANPDSCDLSFDYNFNGVHVKSLTLEVTTNGGAAWTVLWSDSGNKGNVWRKKFIDLDGYNGMTAQFRFVGRGGNGIRGDLALDNILFYGSTDLGFPDFVHYLDQDGDGFGQPDIFIATCQPASFPGYVSNADDCDDYDFFRNPAAAEYLCDGVDSDCDGDADEYFVEPPGTLGAVVCGGADGFVVAFPVAYGLINWYETAADGNPVATGDTLHLPPNLLVNNSTDTLFLTYFAEETTLTNCVSNERTAATVAILPRPEISTTDTPEACAGKPFDLSTVNILDANGLNGSLQFFDQLPLETGNEVGPVVFPTATTDFFILSTAASGCRDTTSFTYTVQPGPVAQIPNAPTICRNTSKQISVADVGNGTAPLTYEWNNSENTPSIAIFSNSMLGGIDEYAVTITAANGCSSADTLAVTTIVNVNQVASLGSPVTTCNGSDGTIGLTPLDGVSPYTYEWAGGTISNQPGALMLTGLQQGSYSFTITDSSPEQCAFVVPVVLVNGPSAVVEIDEVASVSCHGGGDGCISLNVIGSNPSVSWSNGATGEVNCGLSAGIYTATVTEGSCENVLSIPVGEPEALFVKPNTEHVTCFGGNDGEISLTIFGGVQPYTYHWSTGSGSETISNLIAGFYDLTVTDARGCEAQLVGIPVTQPTQISLASLGFQQPTCSGAHDGEISVEAGGGSAPYSYTWSNGGAGTTLTNLPQGSYTITIRDKNACEFSQTIFLPEPQPLAISLIEMNPPTCTGLTNGSLEIGVSGGAGVYQFDWSSGFASQNLSGIGAGEFSVTVTDFFGCTATDTFSVAPAPEIMSIVIDETDPPCVGRDIGRVEAIVQSGGQAPFSFNWSTDDSGPVLDSITYGSYTVTVEDANGCERTATAILDSVQVLTLDFQAFPPACAGQANGQLALTVSGGTAPLEIRWSDGQLGPVASGLLAQNHAATVTDALGCTNYLDIIPLTEPGPLLIHLDEIESIACHGGDEGLVEISVTGGVVPFAFNWSNGATTEDITGLSEGSFSVSVQDANGCVTVLGGLVVEAHDPLAPQSSLGLPTNSCESLQIDDVCVTVNGGVAPYQFDWDTGDTTACILDPPPGDYHVTITDAAGCTTEFMSVKVPEQYSAITTQQVPTGQEVVCFGTSQGQLSIVIQGGSAPYQFNWSNGNYGQTVGTTLFNPNLSVGQYRVTITDNNGCTAVSPTMAVTTNGAVLSTIPGNLVQHVKCKFGSDGAIVLQVSGGLPPYSFLWENAAGDSIFNDQNITGLPAGMYFVTVTDQIGCTGQAMTPINEPATALVLDSVLIDAVSCFGDEDGGISVVPQGGQTPYHFDWDTGAISQGIDGLIVGSYTVTVSDGNGCEKSAVFEVTGPAAPISVAVLDSAGVSCFGESDGFIDINVVGGTPPYSYNWNTVSFDEDLANATAGEYNLVLFDAQNCMFSAVFTLSSPSELSVVLSSTPETLGQQDGTATASPAGGTPPYTFVWDNDQTGQTIENLATGFYEVTVTDDNFCEETGLVFVDFYSGVSENQGATKFFISPNPTSGRTWLGVSAGQQVAAELKIFNLTGQLVLVKNAALSSNSRFPLDLGAQPPGVYLALVSIEGMPVFQTKILVHRP